MADINKVILVGRLTRDCELKQLSNVTVCNFSVAVNRRVNQGGNWVDEPNFFDIELYGNLGTALQQYLLKGQQVAVEGALRQSRWETSDGQKRSRITITANNVQLLGSGNRGTSTAQGTAPTHNQAQQEQYVGNINPDGGQQNNSSGAGYQNNQAQANNDFQDDIPF